METTTQRRTKPRERNSLLKKYYGLKDTTAQPQPIVEDKPFDLDGNTFNSSKYFASLLKVKPLQGLIEKDNELVGEIREIDGDMKTLVYENYNKFISATDTIRKMKSNVQDMESEMSRLNENISGISKQSKLINQDLGPNRKKIQQLSNVHNSLKRLQFIFELPNRLQHCLTKKRYSQAVKYYSKASKLLDHYKHMAAFKGIERDCHQIMDTVKQDIWIAMTDTSVNLQKIAEETKLLLLLNEDPQKLWKKYIEIQISMLNRKQRENSNPVSIKDLILFYIVPLEDIVKHFETLFLAEEQVSEHDVSSVANLNFKEKEEARNDLLTAIHPHIETFFKLANEFIELPKNISMKDTTLPQVQHLSELKSSLFDHTHALKSVAKIDERMIKLTADWEHDLINGLFDSSLTGLREHVNKFILSLQEQKDDSTEFDTDGIAGFIQDTQTWLIDYLINSCLLPLKECLDITQPQTLSRIQVGVKTIWQKIANRFENVYQTNKLDKSSLQIFMLVGSRLCYDLADNGIFQVYSLFSSQFCKQPSTPDHGTYHSPDLDSKIEPALIPDMNDTIESYLKTGQALLNKQMMQEGYRLSSRIQEAYLFMNITSVIQVSEIWYLVYNRLKYTENLVESVYPQSQNTPQRTSIDNSESEYDYGPYSTKNVLQSTHSLTTVSSISEVQPLPPSTRFGSNDMTLNMMNNIDKLFAERVDIYRKVDPTPIGICTGLILILLKSFLEVTREMKMDTVYYQQIQVDIEYIKRVIWPYVGEEKWASTMLQEVLSSVYTRCSSPVSINQDELALILTP
ncbi:Vps51/Vps67-domain-containing protein [Helicostylum pulchrum]|nr:Vps51/Vps67-domain-containing protein [Helicostylum pulchrum]